MDAHGQLDQAEFTRLFSERDDRPIRIAE